VCFILAPTYGLIGLAFARVTQNVIVLLSSWFLLRRYLPLLPVLPCKWSRKIFNEIIGYSINFQIISLFVMLYDPVTKALLSRFGGLSALGYYEMASRMIIQLRALIVSANQVIVPAIADLQERIPDKIQLLYLTSYQLLFYLALPLFSLIIVLTPLISQLWIGHYERIFVTFTTLLAIGWFLNTLASPAYFANLGIGKLRWNVLGHIAIALLNAGFGLLLGILYGGIGVVLAWVFSLALGSSIIYLSYHATHKIPLTELLPKPSRIITISCIIIIPSALLIFDKLNNLSNTVIANSIITLSFSTVVLVLFWLHPTRKQLVEWITDKLSKKSAVL